MPGYAVVDPEAAGLRPAPLKSLPPATIRAALGRAPVVAALAPRSVPTSTPPALSDPAPTQVGPAQVGPAQVAPAEPAPPARSPQQAPSSPASSPAAPVAAAAAPADAAAPAETGTRPAVRLRRGDIVVFAGQMRVPREVWQNRAVAAGLVPYPAVTPRVRLVVAADPSALSGKARAALELGIPVITEEEFGRLVSQRCRRPGG